MAKAKLTQEEWNKQNSELEKVKNAKSTDFEKKKRQSSEAQQELDKQQSIANTAQEKINQLVREGASEEQINYEKAKRDNANNEINKNGGLKDQLDKAKKNENDAKTELDKANKNYEEFQKQNPETIANEEAKKEQEKIDKNDVKIKSNIDKCDDPRENIHKTVCFKAGILPSTDYAIKFCKWLKENSFDSEGNCIWYKLDENNNSIIDSQALKSLKSDWTLERAGKKQDKDKDEREEEKLQNTKEKEIKKWASYLKKSRQKYFDEAHANYGSEIVKVIPDEVSSKEDIIKLAEYAYTHPDVIGVPPETSFDDIKKNSPGVLDSACKLVWNKKNSILSIKNDMPEESQKAAEDPKLNPNATAAFLKGQMSNTFALANQGLQLATNPEIAMQMAKLCTDATAAATAKLTQRVTEKLTESMAQILDVSEIMAIPVTAATEMANKIMKPDQIMQKIMDDMIDDKLEIDAKAAVSDNINNTVSNITQKVANIQNSVGQKLKVFNNGAEKIIGTINQSPSWYIDNVNKLEIQAEKEILKGIDSATITILEGKQQMHDFMVGQISYTLAAPINKELERVQREILRKVEWLINKAKAVAKAATAKAIMKILGLLGA